MKYKTTVSHDKIELTPNEYREIITLAIIGKNLSEADAPGIASGIRSNITAERLEQLARYCTHDPATNTKPVAVNIDITYEAQRPA